MEHGREAAAEEREQLALGLVHQLPLLDLFLVLQPMTTDLLATGERCLVTKSWWLVNSQILYIYLPTFISNSVISLIPSFQHIFFSCHFKTSENRRQFFHKNLFFCFVSNLCCLPSFQGIHIILSIQNTMVALYKVTALFSFLLYKV